MFLKWIRHPAALVCVGCAVWFAACSTQLPVKGVQAYDRCDYSTASKIFEVKAKEEGNEQGKDLALYTTALLSSSLAQGDYPTAERSADTLMQLMFAQGGDTKRGTASLISAEAIKVFKGEPFEKAMAAVYTGILYYNKKDYDNARAAFGKAVLATHQKQAKNREDFALPYLLQAKVFLKTGDTDNAKVALEKANRAQPGNPYLSLEKLNNSNVLYLMELGRAPKKTRTGPGDSLIDWQRQNYPEREARVFLDGQELGKSALVGDLTVQAKTKGTTGKDVVQGTKGALKEASTITAIIATDQALKGNETAAWVALGTGVFALANQSQADTRQWELLPDLISTVVAHVPEGEHEMRVQYYDRSGAKLSQYDQVWYHLQFKPDVDWIFLVRAMPCQSWQGAGVKKKVS